MNDTIEPDNVIVFNLFDLEIGVFFNPDVFEKFFSEKGINIPLIDQSNAMAVQVHDAEKIPYFAFWIPVNTPVHKIVHECVHMVDFVFNFYSLPTGCKNTELRAHMVEYFLSKLLTFVGHEYAK